jgi:hypothetical protein
MIVRASVEIDRAIGLENARALVNVTGQASDLTDPAIETGRGAVAIGPATVIVRASVAPGQVVAIDR